MYTSILTALGGLGLFLLGMQLMTDGLRAMTGNRLRRFLQNSTKTPRSGAISGAIATAILQSSSATIVATVGFVSAGLMTFPQALGIIFGANIGTTITGWMVAILGFKLKLGLIALPLVLAGVLIRIFARARWKPVGVMLAGFSLLFVGIEALHEGIAFLEGVVHPDVFPQDTWSGRLQLVLIGVAITLVTQSSSAGVATALAALAAGAISFPQAAAMVIGMDVGTTATAALATLGGSVTTRRTGYAHVIYNILTGTMAYFLLTPLDKLAGFLKTSAIGFDPQIGLVAFHSSFNLLGVLLIIGVTPQFARLVAFLVPARGIDLTGRLDNRFLKDPATALKAAQVTVKDIDCAVFGSLSSLLQTGVSTQSETELQQYDIAVDTTRAYADRIRTMPEDGPLYDEHRALFHSLDHLERMLRRFQQIDRIETLDRDPELREKANELRTAIEAFLRDGITLETAETFNHLRKTFRDDRHSYRAQTIDRASRDEIETEEAMARLDAIRWLHRVTYHLWRISHYRLLAEGIAVPETGTGPEPLEDED